MSTIPKPDQPLQPQPGQYTPWRWPFDPERPYLLPVRQAEGIIENGWIAQYRGTSFLSHWIQYATGSVHSHSSMLRRNVGNGVDVLDLVEGRGGAARPLSADVNLLPGKIDVFSIDIARWPEFDGLAAVRYMRAMTARDYGWGGVVRLLLLRVPFLRRLWRFDTDDARDSKQAPFCSHAVCSACRIGGGVDPVPRKTDDLTTPADLTTSLLFQYEFTLIP